jgi:hypothetical protein
LYYTCVDGIYTGICIDFERVEKLKKKGKKKKKPGRKRRRRRIGESSFPGNHG